MNLKVLTVFDGLWPTGINIMGGSSIYELQKRLASYRIDIHILTTLSMQASPLWREKFKKKLEAEGIHFHYITNGIFNNFIGEATHLQFLISKIHFFIQVLKLTTCLFFFTYFA